MIIYLESLMTNKKLASIRKAIEYILLRM